MRVGSALRIAVAVRIQGKLWGERTEDWAEIASK
jgi:hypothetical protein